MYFYSNYTSHVWGGFDVVIIPWILSVTICHICNYNKKDEPPKNQGRRRLSSHFVCNM